MTAPADAKLVQLSPATRAVIHRNGVIFLRGTTNWTLSDTELRKLIRHTTEPTQ